MDFKTCSSNLLSTGSCDGSLNTEQYTFNLLSSPVLISSGGIWIAILLAILIQLYELHVVHGSGSIFQRKYSASSESLSAELKLRYWLFITRRFPISNMFLCCALLFLSSVAWLGILNREMWVGRILQILLVWSFSVPISLFIFNVIGIIKYLPYSLNEWQNCVSQLTWWGWLALKLVFGGSDTSVILFTAIWYISFCWIIWPFRYFFHYRSTIFTASPAVADVFVVNMLIHFALLLSWLFYMHMIALGTSKWLARKLSSKYWPHITLVVAVWSVVCVLRVFWFLCTNFWTMSFWGSWVVFSFTHVHILALFGYLPICTALMQRENAALHLKEPFVLTYVSEHTTTPGAGQGNLASTEPPPLAPIDQIQQQKEKETAHLTKEAGAVFEDLLDATTRKFVFQTHPKADKAEEDAQKRERRNEDAELYLKLMVEAIATCMQLRSISAKHSR